MVYFSTELFRNHCKISKIHNVNIQAFTSADTPGVQPAFLIFWITKYINKYYQWSYCSFPNTSFRFINPLLSLLPTDLSNKFIQNMHEIKVLIRAGVKELQFKIQTDWSSAYPVIIYINIFSTPTINQLAELFSTYNNKSNFELQICNAI